MLSFSRWRRLLIAGFGLLGIHPAAAQIIDQYFPQGVPGYDTGLGVTVQSRARGEYVAPGVQLGDIVLKPVISEGLGFNSNVAGLPKAQGSLLMDTSLLLQASTDWSRGGLYTYFNLDQKQYPDLPSQDQLNWIGSIGGTHDFGRDQLSISYTHFNLEQTPADVGSLNFQVPELFHVDDTRLAYKVNLGRFSITPNVQVTNYTFDQATIADQTISQKYRNRVLMVGTLAFRYEFNPQHNVIVAVNGFDTRYTSQQLGEPTLDNSGASILVGLEYTANGVFRYRGLIGLEQRSYASGIFRTQTALVGEGDLIWTPTGLTTLTLTVSRAIEDAAAEATVGYVYTTGRVTIDHEYSRNILLQAVASFQAANYQQNEGSQNLASLRGSVTWLLNRNMSLEGSYAYSRSNASQGTVGFIGETYRQNTLLLRLHFAL